MLAQVTLLKILPAKLGTQHLLILLPKNKTLPKDCPHRELLQAVMARRNIKLDETDKAALAANTDDGRLIVWAMLDHSKDIFALQTQVRKALQLLLDDQPTQITLIVLGDATQRQQAAELAVYGAWVNSALLPMHKKKDERRALKKIELFGCTDQTIFPPLKAQAEGNILCRTLTMLPPNELTPARYRTRIQVLAKQHGWQRK